MDRYCSLTLECMKKKFQFPQYGVYFTTAYDSDELPVMNVIQRKVRNNEFFGLLTEALIYSKGKYSRDLILFNIDCYL